MSLAHDLFIFEGGGVECPDLDFVYADTDSHANEIAELYSYTEQPELQLNVKAFEDQMEQYGLPPCWQRLQNEERKSVLMKLLNQLEVSNKPLRMKAARCILYIAQVKYIFAIIRFKIFFRFETQFNMSSYFKTFSF